MQRAKKTKGSRKINKFLLEEWGWAYLLVAPTIIGLIILNIIPFVQTIIMSFYKKVGLFGTKYVGFGNFEKLFTDSQVWQSTGNTMLYMLYTVPIGIIIALILAVFLNSKIKGRNLFRGIYFLPMVVAPAAVAMVWRWIFNGEFGILNVFVKILGGTNVNWLSQPGISLVSCAIIGIWSAVGYDLVLLLAGLQSIPKTYYEAAEIDGANGVQKFINITLPQISPTLFFVLIMRTMASIKQFDTIYLLFKPANPAYKKTITLMVQFYREAFEKFSEGYAATIVLWSFVIIGVITLIQFWGEKKFVNYD